MKTIGQRVRDTRKARGWKQQTLADKAGISQHYLSEIETGARRGNLDVLAALAAALEVPVSVLVDGDQALPDISVLPAPIVWLIQHFGQDLDADDLNAVLEYAEGRIALKRSRETGAVGYQAPQVHQAEEEPPEDKSA
jgi:transcriptional regulator with XRE-family HTH domain